MYTVSSSAMWSRKCYPKTRILKPTDSHPRGPKTVSKTFRWASDFLDRLVMAFGLPTVTKKNAKVEDRCHYMLSVELDVLKQRWPQKNQLAAFYILSETRRPHQALRSMEQAVQDRLGRADRSNPHVRDTVGVWEWSSMPTSIERHFWCMCLWWYYGHGSWKTESVLLHAQQALPLHSTKSDKTKLGLFGNKELSNWYWVVMGVSKWNLLKCHYMSLS